MMNSKFLTIRKLRLHGARVIREIGVMVEHVKAGNDEDLMDKIKQVSIHHISKRFLIKITSVQAKSYSCFQIIYN